MNILEIIIILLVIDSFLNDLKTGETGFFPDLTDKLSEWSHDQSGFLSNPNPKAISNPQKIHNSCNCFFFSLPHC